MRRTTSRIVAALAAIAAIAAALSIAMPALAGGLSVMPTRVDFAGGRAVQSLLLTNTSGETITVELESTVWPADAANQQANDIVATPAVVTLPPGQRSRVRVGLLRKASGDVERAYRLYVTELPTPSGKGGVGIGVTLRVGIPVFVAPDQPQSAELNWSLRESDKGWLLEAANAGNLHTRIAEATLAGGGLDQRVQLASPYVMARSSLAIPLSGKPSAGTRIRWTEGGNERESALVLP